VVSLGAGGALWVSAERVYRLRAPTVRIRSKVGAGDCTVAGIVLALSRGWTERQALALGVAAGAAAVMTPGTKLCHCEDVDRLYAELDH
jgi:6-phosphofructokinase 2